MPEFLVIFLEFFKIGLFAVGGGLATLPFLYELADKYPWFTYDMIADMIAISESTPGPIGVNMATYTGFQSSGVLGGVFTTMGIVTPSVIIIILISRFMERFRTARTVENAFSALRPAVTGMIAAAGYGVIYGALLNPQALGAGFAIQSLFKFKEIILFAVILFLTNKFHRHPLLYIGLAAAAGIIFRF